MVAAFVLYPCQAESQVYLYGRAGFQTGGGPAAVAFGDFNGDKRIDLAIANSNANTVSILLGSPSGAFAPKRDYDTGKGPAFLVAADFNGDKKLDLAVVNQTDATVSILLGNGDGTFQPHVDYAVGNLPVGIVAADFNRDGRLDLAVVNGNDNTVSILLGLGNGRFQSQKLVPVGSDPTSLGIGDFNRDGKVDLITSNVSAGTVSVLLSKGDGTFTVIDSPTGILSPDFSALAVGDFDRDGKLDVVVSSIRGPLLYLRGKGNGSFDSPVAISSSATARVRCIVAGDFNHDGKLDLLEPGTGGMWVLPGNGEGTFGRPVISPLGGLNDADTFTSADVNGDGAVDLVLTNQNLNEIDVLLGNGNGTFVNSKTIPSAPTIYGPDAAAAADFNGDGKLDIAVAETNFPHGQISVQLGRGNGTFENPIISPLASSAINNSDLMLSADFNGDGKADLLVVDDYTKGFQVLLGKGDGSFKPPVNTSLGSVGSIAAGDFNGDGKADLAVTENGALHIYLSNGNGTFRAGPQYTSPLYSTIAVADVDNDGQLDLVLTSFGSPLMAFLGNGNGTFQKPISGPSAIYSGGMVLRDFNGDGKVDLAVGTYSGIGFLAGNGDGTFQNPVYSNSSFQFMGRMLSGDFNGDGRPDLVTYPPGNTTLSGAVVMIGNGDGTFGPPIAYGQTGPWPVDLFIGDFNGDKVDDFGMPTQDSTSGVDVVNLYLTAPALNLFPTALNFGVQPVGKTSPSKKIELTNAGNARLRISKVTTSGNFLEQNQCGTGLGIGKDCSAQIFFKPAAKGVRAGEVSILDNARSSPQQVQLSGVGK